MAYNDDQNDIPLPAGGDSKRKSSALLPKYFRTNANRKFLESTIDQLVQPGVIEKVEGFLGRKTTPAFNVNDNYIGDVSKDRENYQLEPAVVIKDNIDNIVDYTDYNDIINAIKTRAGQVDNHNLLTQQEYYAWNPMINWDSLVNFRQYYWLPTGPQSVPVFGLQEDTTSTYTVTTRNNGDNVVYVFSPNGFTQNPIIKLYRGQTYKFVIDSQGYPFTIKTQRSLSPGFNLDVEGLEQSIENGIIEFTPNENTPDTLFYQAANEIDTGGIIQVFDLVENSSIDIENEILGKQTYTTSQGWSLTNGMKVYFLGKVIPEKYAEGEWYVEGVGDSIKLIKENTLEIPAAYSSRKEIPFDSENFDRNPFGTANSFGSDKDYIVINRSSPDGNAWCRYNRWFHIDTISKSAEINGQQVDIDQNARASRPIIEFNSGIKLFNFGWKRKTDVDLIDTVTTDIFSTIEGSAGYNIDGISVTEGMRILFTAEQDILAKNKVYQVKFINFGGEGRATNRQITLNEIDDSNPLEGENVLVKSGNKFAGKIFFFDGSDWKLGQEKTSVNQAPLFDLFNKDGFSLADLSYYETPTFRGNKIFSYSEGDGTNDIELGFPLDYRSIENVGDIVFNFDLLTETYQYQDDSFVLNINSDVCYVKKYDDREEFIFENGWIKANTKSQQKIIRQQVINSVKNNFEIDCFKTPITTNDFTLTVNVNGILNTNWTLTQINGSVTVTFNNDLKTGDNLVFKIRSDKEKNENGYYEIPASLEKNPLNKNISKFTLGEVNDHVSSIVEKAENFEGVFPGSSNLRDLPKISELGEKFVQHSDITPFSMFTLTSKQFNIIDAIDFAKEEYEKFKRNFIKVASTLGFDGEPKYHVDAILTELFKTTNKESPFYFSDMVPQGGAKLVEHRVFNVSDKFYAMSQIIDLTAVSEKAVLVYLNETQLIKERDYNINNQGFVEILVDLNLNDNIYIFEYENTDGNFIPQTPSKLGILPKYIPEIYIDDSYIEPQKVILGHDGSKIIAYNDFRDDLLLELEKRIYNNIKQEYNKEIFDIFDYIPSEHRNTGYTKENLNAPMISDFISWLSIVGSKDYLLSTDYTTSQYFNSGNSFTFNYGFMSSPSGKPLPGWWREVYKFAFDTATPHLTPWEMLGYRVKPNWWEDQYGPAPYTKENLILWEDLEAGVHKVPGRAPTYDDKFKRPGLTKFIPVDSAGNLLSPLDSGFAKEYIDVLSRRPFKFGDGAPAENAWRNTSGYNFSLLKSFIINNPLGVIGRTLDMSRIERDISGNLVNSNTNKRVSIDSIVFPNNVNDETRIITSGLINYINDYLYKTTDINLGSLKNHLSRLDVNIGAKLGGFTNKDKFKLILDSRSPYNQGNVFVPDENYEIFVNTSKPIDLISYSGVLIEKTAQGFIVKGYDIDNPVFYIYPHLVSTNDRSINVGGVTERFSEFTLGLTYTLGDVVRYQGKFYIAKETHTANIFTETSWRVLPELPTRGGAAALIRRRFNTIDIDTVPYGTLYSTIQEVVDFLLGYEQYLISKGFVFDNFNNNKGIIENWTNSVKEFMFWSTEGWGEGAVITLSPGASQIKLTTEYSVVDNVYDVFGLNYIYGADGRIIDKNNLRIDRSNANTFTIRSVNPSVGIYHINMPLVQTEHAVVLNNQTVFRDVIYDQEPGYRQERIKVLGYRSDNWTGSLNIPGFIYDSAEVVEWESYTDYTIGQIVKYKEFYYVAKEKIVGSENFDFSYWQQLAERPEPKLYTNFDYRINQFADFYDLDSDNFDLDQQRLAQHLIGYQKRQYLQNIINDDVSQYKFYQGMIQEKGTANSLNKLFDALSSANKDSVEFFEEWAVRSGQYGASSGFEEVEFKISEKDVRLSPQPVELVDSLPRNATDLVIRQLPSNVYLTPEGYNHKPFPTNTYLETTEYVPTAGFVRPEDVTFSLLNKEDILNIDINAVESNEYVWIGKGDPTWSVEKHVQIGIRITSIDTSSNDGELILELDSPVGSLINKDSIVGINDIEGYNGFYKVNNVILNKVYINASDLGANPDADGYLSIFRNNRIENLVKANEHAEESITDNEILWIDDNNRSNWIVLQNTNRYSLLQRIANPNIFDDQQIGNDKFGTSIAVNQDNTVMAVGSPNLNNGEVQIYNRATNQNNLVFQQSIAPPNFVQGFNQDEIGTSTQEKFGQVVDMSEDGIYLAVGSPFASNIASDYRGEFNDASQYQANEVVRYQNSLWRARFDVEAGATTGADYLSFNSFAQLAVETDSTAINLLTLGNYRMGDTEVNHFLVRAPLSQYNASAIGDKIYLKWNAFTFANTESPFLEERQPFDGLINELNGEFITGEHTILRKVDHVFYIDTFINLPVVGEVVSTDDASSVVVYVANDNGRCVIYTFGSNGQFAPSGQLKVNGTTVVGNYEEDYQDTNPNLSGYWMIGSPYYNNNMSDSTESYIDAGNGLAYIDLISKDDTVEPQKYFNVMDTFQEIGPVNPSSKDSENRRISFISTSTYQSSLPHSPVPNGTFLNDRWFFRAPVEFSDNYDVGDNFYFYALPKDLWNNNDLDEYVPAYDQLLTDELDLLNKEHEIYAVWDGYIDIEIGGIQGLRTSGEPFHLIDRFNQDIFNNPLYDDTTPSGLDPIQFWIRASANGGGGCGRVVWYQTDGNKARLYLTDVRGTFSESDTPNSVTIQRFRPGIDHANEDQNFIPSKINVDSDGGIRIAGDVGPGLGQSEYDALNTGFDFTPVPLVDGDDTADTRVYGNIVKVSLGSREDNVGKIIVARRDLGVWNQVRNVLPATLTLQEIRNEEYWLYTAIEKQGASKEPSYPTSSNLDWEQIFNVKATQTGLESNLANQGIVHIYSKNKSGTYSHQYSLISDRLSNNLYFGSKIKFIQYEGEYYLFVSAKGSGDSGLNISGTGFIQMYKLDTFTVEGIERTEFVIDQDPKFRGIWSSNNKYRTGEIALFTRELGVYAEPGYVEEGYISNVANEGSYVNNGYVQEGYSVTIEDFFDQLYEANTNLDKQGVFNPNDWTPINEIIEYNSTLPNRLGAFINDAIFNDEENLIVEYARDFDVNSNGHVLITSAVLTGTNNAPKSAVLIYRLDRGHYKLSQTIFAPRNDSEFGFNIAINDAGNIIAISEPLSDENAIDQGKVYIYTQQHQNGQAVFVLSQTLQGPKIAAAEQFGYRIQFDSNQFIATSKLGDISQVTTYDNNLTTFDNLFTTFKSSKENTGSVSLYEIVNDVLIYSGQFNYDSDDSSLDLVKFFGENIRLSNNHLYVGLPDLNNNSVEGQVIDFSKPINTKSWNILRSPVDRVNLSKIKGSYIYDTKKQQLLANLDYIDPVQGKVAGPAEQELKYKTYYDPALYNNGNSEVIIDPADVWDERYVGQLWWDLSTVRFINTYQGNVTFQANNLNQLYPNTSVDVYEWIESTLLPSQRDAIAETEEGQVDGITGFSKYGDNSYVQAQVYNKLTGIFENRYFYWVKEPKVVPNLEFRSLSAYDVAQLIRDPIGQGYRFITLLANNRFALANCQDLITNDDIAVNVQYYTIDNQNQNVHNQYQIITEGLESSMPNPALFNKWVDSLVGFDIFTRPVPDTEISPKLRYGIENKPRQSMFVNRFEALKQLTERVNEVFRQNIIVDDYDISDLLKYDNEPLPSENRYDVIVDTDEELQFIGTANLEQAILTPVLENGKIVEVIIDNPGRGYKDINFDPLTSDERTGPSYTITGTGSGAILNLVIDNLGKISRVDIINSGERYEANTTITVRPVSVLVRNDSFVQGKWAIYSRSNNIWSRIKTQEYDVTNYWDYIDWYATGFSAFTKINFTIDATYELDLIDDQIGDIIKVQNIGVGGWLLLEKVDDQIEVDYTTNYRTVGRQTGTIQIRSNLYDIAQSVAGFDTVSYDTQFFDNQPVQETRIILEALRNKILVDDLAIEFNNLFFATVRYALSEQKFVDWVFKTSFIKAKHNAGELTQKTTFQNDNLPSYQNYIEEVKPYKTKIREYISSYEKTEKSSLMTTDFDLPPEYDLSSQSIQPESIKISNNSIYGLSNSINSYPKKHWLDNYAFNVSEIKIKDPGFGYVIPPKITLMNGGGTGATAKATLSGSKISSIKILNPGSGYTSAPTVVIEGSIEEGGHPATAFAQITNNKVRGSKVNVKFDRISKEYKVLSVLETETFIGSGSQLVYDLKWPLDLKPSAINITINNTPSLASEYTYRNQLVESAPYEKYHGFIEFAKPPAAGTSIVITYQRNIELLDASDRINQFYNPTTNQFGKQLNQLMTGVDYGGVEVKSLDFGGGTGWDSDRWYARTWDTYDTTFEDEIFQIDPSTTILDLDKPLEKDVVYNVYKKSQGDIQPIRIDDPNYGTENPVTNTNAIMRSIVGDGIQQTFDLLLYNISVNDNDVIIIRKTTSDGSFIPDPESYDTQLTGGDLAYNTARGVNPEEINVDGDGFVTPTTSSGPEELVPGQLLDTLDIQVYDRVANGGSLIDNRNYIVDGATNQFVIEILPNSNDAVFVKVGNEILIPIEYEVDYKNKVVTLLNTPDAGEKVNIIVMGLNGEQILDIDTFESDGSTTAYSTRVTFDDNYSYYVKVNGEEVNYTLQPDDLGFAAIVFGNAPAQDAIITYGIFYTEQNSPPTYSEVLRDNLTGDGSSVGFKISQTPFTRTPIEQNLVVIVDNKVLQPGYNFETIITTSRNYQVETWQVIPGIIPTEDVSVYIDGVELTPAVDYRWNVAQSEVILFSNVGTSGQILEVFVKTDNEYTIDEDILTFKEAPAEGATIDVVQFSNHDILNIERINYELTAKVSITKNTAPYYKLEQMIGGKFKLRKPAESARYVWVSVNGKLLTPSRDYYVTDDKMFIKIVNALNEGDKVDIIHFTSSPITGRFGYRQFKDMLNRTHFKRLGDENSYFLTKDLKQTDLRIYLNDVSTLPTPSKGSNIPGVVFINGERIEYFIKDEKENTLRQIRRGTLGTSTPEIHLENTDVFDQSIRQTVPYKDEISSQVFTIQDNETEFTLDFTPSSTDEFEVFAAGRRLRKSSMPSYKFQTYNEDGSVNSYINSDSPAGDEILEPEFTINGNILTLNVETVAEQKVIVVRKIGKRWSNDGVSLRNADNEISRFLRAAEVELPK